MKVFRKIGLLFLSLTFAVAVLACDKKTTTTTTTPSPTTTQTTTQMSDLEVRLRSIYQLGVSSGAITGTYEDWLESVRGESGADGREVLLRVSGGYIQWQYSGDASWQNLIAVSALTGANGTNGEDGAETAFRISDGYLQWQHVGDSSWTNLLALSEIAGTDGITPTISISENGYWVINGIVTEFRAVPADPVAETVDLTFELNGGTLDSALAASFLDIPKGDSVTLPIPEKYGYVFAGWFTGDTVNDGQFLNTSIASRDLTLHARWTADSRGIQSLLSTLISGTDYVIEYSLTETSSSEPDYVENWTYSSSVDELGRIHRLQTATFLSGTETTGTLVRSSVLIGEYEYSYTSENDGESVMIGKGLGGSKNRRISWDVPRVDSIYEYFRLEDFQIREDAFIFDYVPSDDGLIAYCHNAASSDVDEENLSAVFYGDTGVLQITMPVWDSTYESYEYTLTQTFRLAGLGNSTNRFLVDEFRNAMVSSLQGIVDIRVAQTYPTPETETPFRALQAEIALGLAQLSDPASLWDAYSSAVDQLWSFPLVADARKIAVEEAKAELSDNLAELSLSATDSSIQAMQALLPSLNADLDAAESAEAVPSLLSAAIDLLKSVYEADPIKIECLAAKERVLGYLQETSFIFQNLISGPDSWMTFESLLDTAKNQIAAASTSEEVFAVWDGFGAVLQASDLMIIPDYAEVLSIWYEEFRWQYLERTAFLLEEDVSWSIAFDSTALPELERLSSASVYDYMHVYIAAREKMDAEYRSEWYNILTEWMITEQEHVLACGTIEEQTLFFVAFNPLNVEMNQMTSGEALICFRIRAKSAFAALPFSDLTRLKISLLEDLIQEKKSLSLTANADSRALMEGIVTDFSLFLGNETLEESDVLVGYYSASEALRNNFDFDPDAVLLEEARKWAEARFTLLRDLFEQPDQYFWNEVETALHQIRVSDNIPQITSAGAEIYAQITGNPLLFISQATYDAFSALLDDSISRWGASGLVLPDPIIEETELFLDSLPGSLFGLAFENFWTVYSHLESAFWTTHSGKEIAIVDAWYMEKSAIVEESCLDEMTARYLAVRAFLAISRDDDLWETVLNRFQLYLIDCPTDPFRLDRKEVSDSLREAIDGYSLIVTSASHSSMESLYSEFVGLIALETDRSAMDSLLDIYRQYLLDVYDEDPEKAAFLNLKDRYAVLLNEFGEILYATVDMSSYAVYDLEDSFFLALDALGDLENTPESVAALEARISIVFSLYYQCGGGGYESLAISHLSEAIESLFYEYATGGNEFMEDQINAMNLLRANAQAQLGASGSIVAALDVYADYAQDLASLRRDAHKAWVISVMQDEYNSLFYKLPEADRSAFTAAYLAVRDRIGNILWEESIDILFGQYSSLAFSQTLDPVLYAKRTAIENIQMWLAFKYWIATDDSRTDLYAAQTAAYDAIYAATTVEEANAAYDDGILALEAAFVEDPVRVSLYETEMNEAAMELNELLAGVVTYASDISDINQVLVIITNAEAAVWTAGSSADLATIVAEAKAAVDALSLTWNETLMEECRTSCLEQLTWFYGCLDPVPGEVESAYIDAYSAVNAATDPLTMLDLTMNFADLVVSYL